MFKNLGGISKLFIAIHLSAIIGVTAQAQEGPQSQATLNKDVQEASKIISGSVGIQENSNLVSAGTPGHQSTTQLDLKLDTKLNWGKIILRQGLVKSHQQEEELDLTNTKLGLRHNKIALHRDLNTVNGIFGRTPTNRRAREKDKLQGAVGIENLMELRLNQGPITINNALSLTKNFHAYTVNADGIPTIEWTLTDIISAEAKLGKVVSLAIETEYLTGQTYRGTTKSSLSVSEEIGFQLSETVALALGHTNGDDLVSSTQKSSNIDAFNENTSTIYGSISLDF